MAAPDAVTLADMTGKWMVATKLCSGFEEFLALQGLPWWKRQVSLTANLIAIRSLVIDEADRKELAPVCLHRNSPRNDEAVQRRSRDYTHRH